MNHDNGGSTVRWVYDLEIPVDLCFGKELNTIFLNGWTEY
jgi:hypothetical protein